MGASAADPHATITLVLKLAGSRPNYGLQYECPYFVTYLVPSERYDTKLLRFYMAGYHHVWANNAASPFWMLDTAYADGRMDVSDQYDVKL